MTTDILGITAGAGGSGCRASSCHLVGQDQGAADYPPRRPGLHTGPVSALRSRRLRAASTRRVKQPTAWAFLPVRPASGGRWAAVWFALAELCLAVFPLAGCLPSLSDHSPPRLKENTRIHT